MYAFVQNVAGYLPEGDNYYSDDWAEARDAMIGRLEEEADNPDSEYDEKQVRDAIETAKHAPANRQILIYLNFRSGSMAFSVEHTEHVEEIAV